MTSSLVLRALQPAALDASIALAKDPALDHHWQQRLERARYHVERARRQYEAVEPLCVVQKCGAQLAILSTAVVQIERHISHSL